MKRKDQRPVAREAAEVNMEEAAGDGGAKISLQEARRRLNMHVDLIPSGNSNRPGTPLRARQITIHNTDNDSPGADARAHASYQKGEDAQRRQVSWHFTVDDGSVYQSLPVSEVGWHAGAHAGNHTTIGIEICENAGIDQAAANDRTALLAAVLLHELGIAFEENIKQHHDWSGKDCPFLLRHPPERWANFLAAVREYYDGIDVDAHENRHGSLDFGALVQAEAPVIATPSVVQARAAGFEGGRGREGSGSDLDEIIQIAANSDIARYEWRDRGRAPLGYIKGMAATFGRVYCKLKAGEEAAMEMAKRNSGDARRDVVAWYQDIFADAGMDNSADGATTLRHLFVLLIGLGMRESSGNYCEGRDRSANNVSAETAEAGLFQTSYNARHGSDLLPRIFARYQASPAGFLEIFQEGASCSPGDFENFGDGPGRDFQRLSKESPAFAAEFAAVGLRNIRSHWGPINTRKAEVRPACDEMLQRVQAVIDASNLCPVLL
jgi:hypothetical protein